MSSQNIVLALHEAIDELNALIDRSERELGPDELRQVTESAARLTLALKAGVARARTLILVYEQARGGPVVKDRKPATVTSIETARRWRQEG